ncbi:hypothetical protein ACHAW5_004761 [Stephanodiscus triporus]|uniref:Uncharacterized protein n=1 Tax=Stephanodiscus triporus TaxID=2934178 RepID=A0ABD3MNP3_9STRA
MPVPDDVVGRPPNSPVIIAHTTKDDPPPKTPPRQGEIPSLPFPDSPAITSYYSIFGDDINAYNPSHASYFPANVIYGFCHWYSMKMDDHPVLTKSLTGGCSSSIGDLFAQYIENVSNLRLDSTGGLHLRRIVAMFCTGLCYGPMMHYIYEFYEHVLPINLDESIDKCIDTDHSKEGGSDPTCIDSVDDAPTSYFCHSTMFHSYYMISHRKYVNAFLHVAIDQGLMAFAFVAVMMFVTGVVEGHWHSLREEFARDYIENIHRLWIAALFAIGPIQMIAFRFLSLKWRALAVSLLDVFEVTIMSYITHRNRDVPV